jgi:hypothetical protein
MKIRLKNQIKENYSKVKVYTFNIYLCKKNEMKTLSLKLDDPIYAEAEEITGHLKIARNRYINEAVSLYNTYQKRRILKNQLAKESNLVSENSLEILKEFELLRDED